MTSKHLSKCGRQHTPNETLLKLGKILLCVQFAFSPENDPRNPSDPMALLPQRSSKTTVQKEPKPK
uniref:Uncharacterized protein n=1 Tax=Solanum tuberosum TaxID=4113 RepID=M0ZXB5_SOLTU